MYKMTEKDRATLAGAIRIMQEYDSREWGEIARTFSEETFLRRALLLYKKERPEAACEKGWEKLFAGPALRFYAAHVAAFHFSGHPTRGRDQEMSKLVKIAGGNLWGDGQKDGNGESRGKGIRECAPGSWYVFGVKAPKIPGAEIWRALGPEENNDRYSQRRRLYEEPGFCEEQTRLYEEEKKRKEETR